MTMVESTSKKVPGPGGHWFFGSIRDFRDRPLELFEESAQNFGDLVRFRFVHKNAFLIRHPDYIRQILQTERSNYDKNTPGIANLRTVLGTGLLTSDGDFWKRQRRIAQPAFHKKRISGFAQSMVEHTDHLVDAWASHESGALDMAQEMMEVTYAIAGATLFSAEVESTAAMAGDSLTEAIRITTDRAWRGLKLPLWVPTGESRAFKRSMRKLDGIVRGLINERRDEPGTHNDLLSMLVEARDEETGEGMTDDQLRDEVLTLLMAGHETTANALSWAFYALAQNPEVVAGIRAEAEVVLGERNPEVEDLKRFEYTNRAIKECMRLFPPAWVFGRNAVEDGLIGGYRIPKGSLVMSSPYLVHRDPRFWPEPERFDPDRFLPDAEASRPKFAYIPFGGGQRLCIGTAMANMEMVIMLVMVLRRFDLSLDFEPPIGIEPLITLRPEGGLPMTVSAR